MREMTKNLEGITVNGVPLKVVVDEMDRDEKQEFRTQELRVMGKTIRVHVKTKGVRNHSGSRTSKGRVLVQNGVWL